MIRAGSCSKLLKRMGSSHCVLGSKNESHHTELAVIDSEHSFNWVNTSQVKALMNAVSDLLNFDLNVDFHVHFP